MMLAEYLRYDQSLTGTKIVCAEGDCGACSVLRFFPHIRGTDAGNYLPVNSCITTVAQLDGSSIVTVDALKNNGELHEVQKAMVSCHGSQCGFCTPGFVMAITGLVEEKITKEQAEIGIQEAKNCMTGNLCRCTGYQPIIDAAVEIDVTKCASLKERFYSSKQKQDLRRSVGTGVAMEGPDFAFFAPKSVQEAVGFLRANPDARIIGAGTDLGVVHNKRKIQLTKLLSLHLIEELYALKRSGTEVILGARVTLTEFRHFIKDLVPELASYLDVFASPQIKNLATVIGNVANASPIGDLPSALLALEAKVVVAHQKGFREIPLSQFFLAYRTTALKAGEIITHLKFDVPPADTTLKFTKNSNRKDLDISAVNLAFRVEWRNRRTREIGRAVLAGGGVAATPLRFKQTEDILRGKLLTTALVDEAVKTLHSEFNPLSDLRASSGYRRVLVENYFRRFLTEMGGDA